MSWVHLFDERGLGSRVGPLEGDGGGDGGGDGIPGRPPPVPGLALPVRTSIRGDRGGLKWVGWDTRRR